MINKIYLILLGLDFFVILVKIFFINFFIDFVLVVLFL